MFRSSAGVALGMATAVASAASGVLILIEPYVTAITAVVVVVVVTIPLVMLWRSLAAEDAELLAVDARPQRHRSRRFQPATSRARC